MMAESDDSWEKHSMDEEELYSDRESSSSSDSRPTSSSEDLPSGDDSDANATGDNDEFRGVQPYRFEPIADPDEQNELAQEDGNEDDRNRLLNTDWCSCGQCTIQASVLNSICCKEAKITSDKMDELDLEDPDQCLTQHPWFEACCLNPATLQTAHKQYQSQYGRRAVQGTVDQKFRHVAYRQVVRWCAGYLGRFNRVPLPSCVMDSIRSAYPNPDGQYKGFRYPPLD